MSPRKAKASSEPAAGGPARISQRPQLRRCATCGAALWAAFDTCGPRTFGPSRQYDAIPVTRRGELFAIADGATTFNHHGDAIVARLASEICSTRAGPPIIVEHHCGKAYEADPLGMRKLFPLYLARDQDSEPPF